MFLGDEIERGTPLNVILCGGHGFCVESVICYRGEQMNKKEFVEWLKGSALRMIRAMAQSAIASMGTSSMTVGFQWEIVLGTAGLAGLASLLMSLTILGER